MALPQISESTIRQYAAEESFQRGQAYYQRGAVIALALRGTTLEADVEGSEPVPYRVQVVLDTGGITEAGCTCPYDWGGWCKHIVAALLACINEPEAVEERAPIDASLSGLDREQLQALLLHLVEREPHLADAIESQVVLLRTASTAPASSGAEPAPRHTPVDPGPFRRQVRAIFRGLDRMSLSDAYWHVGGVVNEVRQVLEQAWAFIKADDGANALTILEAITEEYVAEWEVLDDSDGDASAFFEDLGPAWAEAVLSADLNSRERQTWVGKLTKWQRGLEDYGVDAPFAAAIMGADEGWDYPPLQAILQGASAGAALPDIEEDEEGDYDEDDDLGYASDELTIARLNVLERRGHYQEYLNLAAAMGQVMHYTTMLVRLDRAREAMEYGLGHLATAEDALALAKVLREREDFEGALKIAEHGLTLRTQYGPPAALATWLRDLAAGMGQTELALKAALVAFNAELSLASYLRVEELAGESWPERRGGLLEELRRVRSYYPQGPVDIFLHEGLIDDAIAAVDSGATHTVVEQVVDAAMTTHPDWVITACRKQADPIMGEGRAQYYGAAAQWLAKARTAYRNAGREAEWRAYLNDLLARHARKYKLMPLLKALKS